MKPSDNPLSPFNPNFKSGINWSDMNRAAVYSKNQSKVVNDNRKIGREISISVPISAKAAHNMKCPKKFTVNTK